MTEKIKMKFKKGVASFYIVAFSTLILVIMVTSFSAIIISEVARTSNEDLSQSAYDSALAGIEDAKLVVYDYKACIEGRTTKPVNSALSCEEIKDIIEDEGEGDCDMVAKILGRNSGEGGEVLIKETITGDNSLQQAYTCVKIKAVLDDIQIPISGGDGGKVIQVKLANVDDYEKIKYMNIIWQSGSEAKFAQLTNNKVVFPSPDKSPEPPIIQVGLVQMATNFKLSDFEKTNIDGNEFQTNRGTVLLVPTDDIDKATKSGAENYIGAYNGSKNEIKAKDVVTSNNQRSKNLPHVVYCSGGLCSAKIELPTPIDGVRNENFLVVINFPYEGSNDSGNVRIGFDDRDADYTVTAVGESGDTSTKEIPLKVQISIDSTGRANDLYRRVEARLGGPIDSVVSSNNAIELFGGKNTKALSKELKVTRELSSEDSYEDFLEYLGL